MDCEVGVRIHTKRKKTKMIVVYCGIHHGYKPVILILRPYAPTGTTRRDDDDEFLFCTLSNFKIKR